jgi:hypothetical protein
MKGLGCAEVVIGIRNTQNIAWLMGGNKINNAMTMWRINNEY